MNEFVEECRREWKLLGVPDPLANEMAADLEADLAEAEAEGAAAEEVLGVGAFDPRAFATAWARERGLVRQPQPTRRGLARTFGLPAAVAALALVAIVGAVLVITSPSAPENPAFAIPPPPTLISAAPPDGVFRVQVEALADSNDSGLDTRTVGSLLLIVGLAGLVPLTVLGTWIGRPARLRDV